MIVDITNCDTEPIHIPGFIQPHGILLAINETSMTILQASANCLDYFGKSAPDLVDEPLDGLFASAAVQSLEAARNTGAIGTSPVQVFTVTLKGTQFEGLAHRYDEILILELERSVESDNISFQNLYSLVSGAVSRLESALTADALCQIAVREMRALTGLDKVMIYLFDEGWTGTVVAEDRAEGMDTYLGLRFPATDIPRQARDLYLRNKMRLISDVYADPVIILPNPNPLTGRPLDLSYSKLRSVSPIHIEYLKNMGVGASMSVAIIREGRLAGLFACHHATTKYLTYAVRTACEFLGQVVALQLTAREQAESRERRLRSAAINVGLLKKMTQVDNYVDGLTKNESQLLELTGATGAALCGGDDCVLIGRTPGREAVLEIAAWLNSHKHEVWSTASLPLEIPNLQGSLQEACGVLAVSTSEVHGHSIMWFRPEVVQTVSWAGNPTKALDPRTHQLHPRQSFEVWKEIVRAHSQPWTENEIQAATDLRAAIVGIVLRQAEERAELSTELMHSNQELEAFSYSVSHDLRAPFRHIVGFAQLLEKRIGETLDPTSTRYLTTITNSAEYAGTLVDNLLAFSRMGRSEMRLAQLDMAQLVKEIRDGLTAEIGERNVEWEVGPLPKVHADLAMLRLVVQNLLSNAIKYTRGKDPARIEFHCRDNGEEWEFTVKDNGVGFDMAYSHKLFGVFQRLHRAEEFEGTGIGLANTRRIVNRHGGKTWAEGKLGEGAIFGFSLPKVPLEMQSGEKA